VLSKFIGFLALSLFITLDSEVKILCDTENIPLTMFLFLVLALCTSIEIFLSGDYGIISNFPWEAFLLKCVLYLPSICLFFELNPKYDCLTDELTFIKSKILNILIEIHLIEFDIKTIC